MKHVTSTLLSIALVWAGLKLFRDETTFQAPFIRFFFYGLTLGLTALMLRDPTADHRIESTRSQRVEQILLGALIVAFFVANFDEGLGRFFGRPWIDIGLVTAQATEQLWREGGNPYRDNPLYQFQSFAGYHYGPFMMIAYVPAVWGEALPFKATCLAYLGIIAGLTSYLAVRLKARGDAAVTTVLFVLAGLAVAPFLFHDFAAGINDYFPSAALLAALWAIDRGRWRTAGVLLGLSSSAKFAPAAYLFILLLRRTTPRRFFVTAALAVAATHVPFLIWDAKAFLTNVYLKHFIKEPLGSGIFNLTPRALWPVFPLFQLLAIATLVYRRFRTAPALRGLMQDFLVLGLIMNALHKELHSNHFTWLYVVFVTLLATERHALLDKLVRAFVGPRGSSGTSGSGSLPA